MDGMFYRYDLGLLMSIWLWGWFLGLNSYNIFLVLGFRYNLRKDLFDADPKTNGGLIMLPLSIDNLLELLYSEFFLMLSYLFPRDVLDSLKFYGSPSF